MRRGEVAELDRAAAVQGPHRSGCRTHLDDGSRRPPRPTTRELLAGFDDADPARRAGRRQRRRRSPTLRPTCTAPIRFRLPDDVSDALPRLRRTATLRQRPAIVEAAWALVLAAFSGDHRRGVRRRRVAAGARACPAARTSWACSSTPRPCGCTIDPARPVLDAARRRARPAGRQAGPRAHRARRTSRPISRDRGRRRCSTPSSSSTSCTRAPA